MCEFEDFWAWIENIKMFEDALVCDLNMLN